MQETAVLMSTTKPNIPIYIGIQYLVKTAARPRHQGGELRDGHKYKHHFLLVFLLVDVLQI